MFELFHCIAIPAGAAGLLIGAWICRWMVAPLSGAAQYIQAPTRFSLTDFLWLIFLIQIEWGLVINLVDRQGSRSAEGYFWFVLVMGMLIVACIWLGAVSTLSRAGVRDSKRRGLFTLVALPGMCLVIIGCLLVMASASTLSVNLIGAYVFENRERRGGNHNLILLGMTLGIAAALVPLVPLFKSLNSWIARGVYAEPK